MVQNVQNIFSSIVFIILSIVIFIISDNIKAMTSMGVGPDFLPKVVAVILLILSFSLFIQEIIKWIKHNKRKSNKKSKKNFIRKDLISKTYLNVSITVFILIVYVYLIPKIGFLLSSIFYLIIHFFVLAERKSWNIILFILLALLFSFSVFYIFRLGFSVRLPTM